MFFPQPSRELAEQTFQQILKFKKYLDEPKIKEVLVIGGVNIKEQMSIIQSGVSIFLLYLFINFTYSISKKNLEN